MQVTLFAVQAAKTIEPTSDVAANPLGVLAELLHAAASYPQPFVFKCDTEFAEKVGYQVARKIATGDVIFDTPLIVAD